MKIIERLATLESEMRSMKTWIKFLILVTLGSGTAQFAASMAI